MCQPKKWWWGLLPLALIWVLANLHKAGPIAADLKARAESVGQQVAGRVPGVAPLVASVDGRDVTMAGPLRALDLQPRVLQTVDAEAGVRRVGGGLAAAQPLRPYLWSAERRGDAVILSGAVPDDTTRDANIAAARAVAPNIRVEDQQRVAFGAPAGFAAAAAFALPELSRLAAGKATLSDQSFCFEGAAATTQASRRWWRASPTRRRASPARPAPSPRQWPTRMSGPRRKPPPARSR